MSYHALSSEEVLKKFKTSEKGLSEVQVQKRYGEYGKNVLRTIKKKSNFRIFLSQFNSLLIYILILAAVISGIIGHRVDAIVIGIIVILNGSVGFVQEYKAGEIIEKLKKSLDYKAVVVREGEQKEIDSREIVPGDIILFETGAKVLADCRVLSCENLQTNEAALTGESFPIDKNSEEIEGEIGLAERENMLYAGTTVVRGKVRAVVVGTGNNTEFGKLADLVQKTEDEKMPLEKKLDQFSRNVALVVLGFVGIVFALGVYMGIDKLEMFMTSVSLAIGAIPEGLPAIIAITLAVAIKQMYKVKTLIRKLPAAETLGRATVICTDKTGTLTEEELTVDKIFIGKEEKLAPDGVPLEQGRGKNAKVDFHLKTLAKIGILCNNARDEGYARKPGVPSDEGNIFGDPTEVALIKFANKLKMSKRKFTEENERVKEFSFDSTRKMMSIIRTDGKMNTSYVKGASGIILENCTKELVGNKVRVIDKARRKELLAVVHKMEKEGLRVLGLAFRQLTKADQKNAESNLTFAGFVGMIDPPREEVKEAMKEAIEAGIKIKIITGDAALTTQAIAEKIGLKGEVIVGRDLAKLPEEKWDEVVRTKTIFARVTPEQKLKVVETLKKQAETVAVTGDGVNDILALKRADIGISMGIRGSDVARDSSDMVLLDDNFASIIKATKQGRRVFANMKKSVKFLLAANAGEVLAVFFSLLIGLPLPFLPLAILWMNLVTDSLPALALAVEPASEGIMKRKPRKEGLLECSWSSVIVAGIVFSALTIGIFMWAEGSGLELARTLALTVAIFFELFFAFGVKNKKFFGGREIFNNKWLVYAFLVSAALQLIAIYTPLGVVFGLVPLSMSQLGLSVLLGFLGVFVIEVLKVGKGFLRKKVLSSVN